jgi:hypothetical protein
MNDNDLLNRIPKEHYTLHNGELIRVGDLLKKLYEKNTSNGSARRRKNNTVARTGKDT